MKGRPHVPDTAEKTITLPAAPSSAAAAREFVRVFLQMSRHGGLEDAALLCVSELVANATRHTDSQHCRVHVVDAPGDLLIEVADDAPEMPVRSPLHEGSEQGRGLHIIEALAGEWGVRRQSGDGKWVWLRLCEP